MQVTGEPIEYASKMRDPATHAEASHRRRHVYDGGNVFQLAGIVAEFFMVMLRWANNANASQWPDFLVNERGFRSSQISDGGSENLLKLECCTVVKMSFPRSFPNALPVESTTIHPRVSRRSSSGQLSLSGGSTDIPFRRYRVQRAPSLDECSGMPLLSPWTCFTPLAGILFCRARFSTPSRTKPADYGSTTELATVLFLRSLLRACA